MFIQASEPALHGSVRHQSDSFLPRLRQFLIDQIAFSLKVRSQGGRCGADCGPAQRWPPAVKELDSERLNPNVWFILFSALAFARAVAEEVEPCRLPV